MSPRQLLPFLAAFGILLTGCPSTTSPACADDTACGAGLKCRFGACLPACAKDSECGNAQVCKSGECVPRPECTENAQCRAGFACQNGKCSCTADDVCAVNESCVQGRCITPAACKLTSDCKTPNTTCEVTSGSCVPACQRAADCAPQLSPEAAGALWSCLDQQCTRRCINDTTCGGPGVICNEGYCEAAQCKTMSDCAGGQYCTNADRGRCLTYVECKNTTECGPNDACRKFSAAECPPGFDCTKQICLELPKCLVDADCTTQPPNSKRFGYCQDTHCRTAAACGASASCAAGTECIASLCVPAVCRGQGTCAGSEQCSGGVCRAPPPGEEVLSFRLVPSDATLEVGDVVNFSVVAYRLDGTSSPMPSGVQFTVVDSTGAPSSVATVDAAGHVTGAVAGDATLRANVPNASLPPQTASLHVFAKVTSGRRVLVVDAATGSPLSGAAVRACVDVACSTPLDATTDASGAANFASIGAGAVSFSVVAPGTRTSDGLPLYERASVIGTHAADVLLPLRTNPVHAEAGYSATIGFEQVHSVGQYWLGYTVGSFSDLPSVDTRQLLGDTFLVELPAVGQRIPMPGTTVLFSEIAFSFSVPIKSRAYAFGDPGTARHVIGFGGKVNINQVLEARSPSLLAYMGAFDTDIRTFQNVDARALVQDATDIDGDGLCSNPIKCNSGTEEVPDYNAFTSIAFRPSKPQVLRTEVDVSPLPAGFDSVIVAIAATSSRSGVLPLGLTSATAGVIGGSGARTVAPLTLQSATPLSGLEVSSIGVWAVGVGTGTTALTGRMTRGASLPTKAVVPAFLPAVGLGVLSAGTRTYSPAQPQWSQVAMAGARLGRLAITGSQTRHTVYVAIDAASTALTIPPAPPVMGADPISQGSVSIEISALDLGPSITADDALSLAGPNLLTLPSTLNAYSRFER